MGAPQYEQAGADIAGGGTAGTIPVWSTGTTLGDSQLIQSATVIYTTTRNFGVGAGSSAASAPLHAFGPVADWTAKIQGSTTSGSSYGLLIRAGTTSADTALSVQGPTGTPSLLFVRGDGNVGIGTATPSVKFQVNQTTANINSAYFQSVNTAGQSFGPYIDAGTNSSDYALLVRNAATSTLFKIQGDGNVGIGTASPGTQLHVERAGGTSNAEYLRLRNTTAGTGSAVGIDQYVHSNTVATGRIQHAWNGTTYDTIFSIWNGSALAEGMRIQGGGNVGIGTASPTAALDLPASSTARASLRIQTGAAPTSPNNGDIWFDGTNIKMRVGGVTKTFTLV